MYWESNKDGDMELLLSNNILILLKKDGGSQYSISGVVYIQESFELGMDVFSFPPNLSEASVKSIIEALKKEGEKLVVTAAPETLARDEMHLKIAAYFPSMQWDILLYTHDMEGVFGDVKILLKSKGESEYSVGGQFVQQNGTLGDKPFSFPASLPLSSSVQFPVSLASIMAILQDKPVENPQKKVKEQIDAQWSKVFPSQSVQWETDSVSGDIKGSFGDAEILVAPNGDSSYSVNGQFIQQEGGLDTNEFRFPSSLFEQNKESIFTTLKQKMRLIPLNERVDLPNDPQKKVQKQINDQLKDIFPDMKVLWITNPGSDGRMELSLSGGRFISITKKGLSHYSVGKLWVQSNFQLGKTSFRFPASVTDEEVKSILKAMKDGKERQSVNPQEEVKTKIEKYAKKLLKGKEQGQGQGKWEWTQNPENDSTIEASLPNNVKISVTQEGFSQYSVGGKFIQGDYGLGDGAFGFPPEINIPTLKSIINHLLSRSTGETPVIEDGTLVGLGSLGIQERITTTAENAIKNNNGKGDTCWEWVNNIYIKAGIPNGFYGLHHLHEPNYKLKETQSLLKQQNEQQLEAKLSPGDWIYIHNSNGDDDHGDHSCIFLGWENKEKHLAKVASRQSTKKGAVISVRDLTKQPIRAIFTPKLEVTYYAKNSRRNTKKG